MPVNRNYSDFLSSFHSDKFQGLREAQGFILQQYANNYIDVSDVGIELPTGAGKTLISLLVSEAWRQERHKVAILSANKTLARQMLQEAEALGIPATLMEGKSSEIPPQDIRAYQRATKVAIMNYWVYFNQNPAIDPADLLVMDDAHLAEHCLHSLFSVEITKQRHNDLFIELITNLQARFPDYTVLTDALEGDTSPTSVTELLSFIDQIEVESRIREIIDSSTHLSNDADLWFRWNRIRNSLRDTNVYIGLNSIWIRPYIYPLMSHPHYEKSKQRLFLSATIGDPGDLSRRLGVRQITKIPVVAEHSEKTHGRRFVVMNQFEHEDIPTNLGTVILAALRVQPKSVWLCSSDFEARKYEGLVSEWLNLNNFVDQPTWLLTSNGNEIDHFKASPTGHLFVAGRFDGMDFHSEECRLVVVPTLPRAINIQEEFISAYLRDSGFMMRRLNQRIIQALGRCNRSDDDYGVYILMDRRFTTHFSRESNKEGLPRNIVAEIDMAQDATQFELADLVKKVEDFLQGDFKEYDDTRAGYLLQVPEGVVEQPMPDTSEDEVVGWANLFNSQNYVGAAQRFERCWNANRDTDFLEIGAFHGWQWAKALYLQSLQGELGARERALDVFENAIRRGGQTSWFNRMRGSLNRARQAPIVDQIISDEYSNQLIRIFDEKLENFGTSTTRFDRWCAPITASLQSNNHGQYLEGLENLGKILGYTATRPQYGASTDCRWRGVFGNSRELITFEAKIEHREDQEIFAREVGQAHNQYSRASADLGSKGYSVRGTIVTHLEVLADNAQASIGSIKIIKKSAILSLWERVRLVLSMYRDGWSLHNLQARRTSAEAIRSRVPQTGWLIRALDSDETYIEAHDLLSEWHQ